MTAKRPTRRRAKKPAAAPILRAKLSPPNLGDQFLERPRLTQALTENAARALTLVIADGGYGKTTLLAAFARAVRRPVVWYSLMPSDADLVVFGRHLLEGFRRHAPRFGRSFHSALRETRPGARSAEILGGTLANELSSAKGPAYLLVLDDFQEVASSTPVVTFVDTLLRQLPESLRLVVACRSLPPLSLERLRAKGQLFELNSTHLRLTRDELSRLFDEIYGDPVSDLDLQELEETTLGWPTAVHLVHESLERSGEHSLTEVLADFRSSNLELHDYLSAEVFTRLEEEPRRLLERTSTLSRFDAHLAETLAGIPGPRPLLEGLVRRGLLRTFGIGDEASYECHELVRRFLRQSLEDREGRDAWLDLEAETARALAERGEPERALRHYLVAGREREAARLLRELAPQLARQGRGPALLHYVGDMPPALVRDDPMLQLAHADARQSVGEWDKAEPLYEEILSRARLGGDRDLECRALLGLGKVLNLRGKHEQVLGMAERGLAIAQDTGLEQRVRLLQMKAGAHFYLGQFQAAVQILDEVRALLPPSADSELVVPTVHNLAIALFSQGRFREAVEEFRAALAQVRGTGSPRAALYLSNLAFLLSDLGELPEARRAAEEGLVAAQRFSNRPLQAMCHAALAQLQAMGGDLDAALAALRRAEDLNAELRMAVIAADLLALRGRIFCARGQYLRAVEFLTQAIERLEERPDDPRLVEFQANLAWGELRSGRPRVAQERLQSLVRRAEAGENDYQRMRVNYWLAESLLALGAEDRVIPHLALALRLVRERGYHYFLRVQAREDPEPLLHALAHGIELEVVSSTVVEAGTEIEAALLELLERASPSEAEAVVAVLGEVGGEATARRLEEIARARRGLRSAVRVAARRIGERAGRGLRGPEDVEAPMARLELFGPPQLLIEGRPVAPSAWRTQRALQMLIYLAIHPRGANRDELLEHFWPGRRLAEGRRNFHPTLSYVRHVLPRHDAPAILLEGNFYRLNPDYPLTCDAWELERAIEDGKRESDPEPRARSLEEAVALAGGEYLEGVYGDWATELQARMRDRLEKIRLELGNLYAEQGRFEAALGHFRVAAGLDEFRESTRLAVMECLMRVGNRRAALVEYDKLKGVLRRELSVEPLPSTDEAVRRLLAGESVHGWPDAGTEELSQVEKLQ